MRLSQNRLRRSAFTHYLRRRRGRPDSSVCRARVYENRPGRPYLWYKTLGEKVWTGEYGAGHRWTFPLSSSVEVGGLKDYTPDQIHDWAFNELHLHYMFWVRNTWAGPGHARWYTGVLPFLKTKPRIRTRCPDAIGWCIDD